MSQSSSTMTPSRFAAPPMKPEVFFGRQAVLDRRRHTVGYSLMYRHGDLEERFFRQPLESADTAVEMMMLEWGFERVIGHQYGFVDISTQFLRPELLAGIPSDRGVAVLHDAQLSDDSLAAMRAAAAAGARFALTDLYDLDPKNVARSADLFSFVGIDTTRISMIWLPDLVARARDMFPAAQLIAGNVDDLEGFRATAEMGFDLFHGGFFTELEIVDRRDRAAGSTAALDLIAVSHNPASTIDDVTRVIGSDATLTYEFLRLVNSSAYGLASSVGSIGQAVVLVGMAEVRRFAIVLAMSSRTGELGEELLVVAATRARLAETLAGSDRGLAAMALTAGLLSVIDVVFGTPMDELLAELPLAPVVRDALVDGTGPIGEILDTVVAFERADTAALAGIDPAVKAALLEALARGAAAGEQMRAMLASV